jgi:hypothetical protein
MKSSISFSISRHSDELISTSLDLIEFFLSDYAKYSAPPAETHQHLVKPACGHRELVSILTKNIEI